MRLAESPASQAFEISAGRRNVVKPPSAAASPHYYSVNLSVPMALKTATDIENLVVRLDDSRDSKLLGTNPGSKQRAGVSFCQADANFLTRDKAEAIRRPLASAGRGSENFT